MKSAQLQIRVSPAQKTRLRQLAARAGQDISTYVLSRALPQARARFDDAVRALRDDERRRFGLADIADMLRDTPIADLDLDVPPDGVAQLDVVTSNYLAAMIEQACVDAGVASPTWTSAVAPLDDPWFAADLRTLRPHLLVVSPPPFKRRNLFVDPGVAGRV